MTTATPIVDLVLWGRFLLGAALVLWLLGHVWITRHWNDTAWPLRVVAAVAAGLLLAPAFARAMNFVGLPARPWTVVPAALIVGLALGRQASFRGAMRALDPLARGPWVGAALGACVVAAIAFVVGFAPFAAPPHVHDASNHAFLTWRITQTGSLQAETLFAEPYGRPQLPYLVGMHASAALIAQAGGIAPYLATWLLCALAVMLLPASLALLWRTWDLPPVALAVAALLVPVSRFVPPGALTWGGFGLVVGMFLVPLAALLLVRAWSSRSGWLALLAGVALGTLTHVHGSQAMVALVMTGVTLALRPARPQMRWSVAMLLLGLAASLGLYAFSNVANAYVESGMTSIARTRTEASRLLERFLKSGGAAPQLVVWWIAALALSLRTRWGAIARVSLALGALTIALGAFGDPVSRTLTTPFYREPWRVQYVQLFLAPALMGLAALGVTRWTASWGRGFAFGAALVGLAVFVGLPQTSIVRLYRETARSVPFTRADYEHAMSLRSVVGEDEWVANDPNDGSIWAMHVSGCRFVRPASWRLHDLRGESVADAVEGLLQDPWPASTRALADHNVRYVYASDTRFEGAAFTRERFDADPRLEPVRSGETSTLYRIRW